MEDNFSINEILSAVDEIQKRHKLKKNVSLKSNPVKKDYTEVPKNTLRLIEEAENKN